MLVAFATLVFESDYCMKFWRGPLLVRDEFEYSLFYCIVLYFIYNKRQCDHHETR
jgi:hypothetical protein